MSETRKKRKGQPAGVGDQQTLRLEWWPASRLAEHPDNWRLHGEAQSRALRAMVDRVGYAGACLYNETTGHMIDGHLRRKLARRGEKLPVLVGRWSAEQEREILATLDPLAAMATADAEALEDLLDELDLEGPGLDELSASLDALARRDGAVVVEDATEASAKASVGAGAGARGHAAPIAERYLVVIECDTEKQQASLFRRLKKDGLKCRIETS